MKKLKPADAAPQTAPVEQDYSQAARYGRVHVGAHYLFYPKMLNTVYLPLSQIKRCYKRLEDASASVCCGRANFEDCYLMLETAAGTQEKIAVAHAATIDAIIAELTQRNTAIQVGRKADEA